MMAANAFRLHGLMTSSQNSSTLLRTDQNSIHLGINFLAVAQYAGKD
jgi:hypothetical protein